MIQHSFAASHLFSKKRSFLAQVAKKFRSEQAPAPSRGKTASAWKKNDWESDESVKEKEEVLQEESEDEGDFVKRLIDGDKLVNLTTLKSAFEAAPNMSTFKELVKEFPQEIIDRHNGPKDCFAVRCKFTKPLRSCFIAYDVGTMFG